MADAHNECPFVTLRDDRDFKLRLVLVDGLDAASLFITSAAVITNDPAPEDAFRLDGITDIAIAFAMADGKKCARCWRITPEVAAEDDICKRCESVVAGVR